MHLYQRNGIWHVDFLDSNGRRRRMSTGQRDERLGRARAAELMHGALVDNLDSGQRAQLGSHLTVGQLLSDTYDKHWRFQRAGDARKSQIAVVMREVGHWSVPSVTFKRLEEYAMGMLNGTIGKRPLRPASVNRKLSLIKTAMNRLMESGELDRMPKFPFYTEDNERERYVSLKEEQKILAWFDENIAPGDTANRYFRHLFVLLIDTGMRASEGLGLTPERLVEGGTVVALPKATRGAGRLDRTKSGKARRVPLTVRAQAAVRELMANPHHRQHPEGNWASLRFSRLMDRVGLPDIGLHTLRHTCASRLVQRGASLYVVAAWLGHANIKTTQRYAHLAPSNLQAALSLLEPAGDPAQLPSTAERFPLPVAQEDCNGTQRPENLH